VHGQRKGAACAAPVLVELTRAYLPRFVLPLSRVSFAARFAAPGLAGVAAGALAFGFAPFLGAGMVFSRKRFTTQLWLEKIYRFYRQIQEPAGKSGKFNQTAPGLA
jgi:hypothetical protein